MTNALVPTNGTHELSRIVAPQAFNLGELTSIGQILAESGFWSDSKQRSQAIAKVLAGQELGIGPVAAMTGLYIINGKVVISANVMAGAVKRSGRYDYRIRKLEKTGCTIEFFERGQSCGVSTFDEDDAREAKLNGDNWLKFRRNMMFARALANGVRWFCPDVFSSTVYTAEELGADVDGETGEILREPVRTQAPISREPETPTAQPTDRITEKAMKALHARAKELHDWDHDDLHIEAATRYGVDSLADLTRAQAVELYDWLKSCVPDAPSEQPALDLETPTERSLTARGA